MIVYLDQNKWIDLARIVHSKDRTAEANELLLENKAFVRSGVCVLPLSAVHYMETSKVSNAGRKARLGSVMWEYSGGATITSFKSIIIHEFEVALSKLFPQVKVSPLNFIGKGVAHAFGEKFPSSSSEYIEEQFERSVLTGESVFGESPPKFHSMTFRENFKNHLSKLHKIKSELPRNKWDDVLYAIVLSDIRSPLSEVMVRHNISKEEFEGLGIENLRALIENMPSRQLDLHLHRQVLKNPNYNAKLSDLEDWAGVGVASQYCDVVICEKHLADMLRRDKFKTKARVETDLNKIFQSIGA